MPQQEELHTVEATSPRTSRPQWEATRTKQSICHKIRNYNVTHWADLTRFQASILPKVAPTALVFAAWSSLVCVFYLVPSVGFLKTIGLPNSMLLVTLLGTALGLLLVFRVNTAYDRFWEGRKTWTIMHYQIRNMARLIWVYCTPKTEEEAYSQMAAINMLIAIAAATKHSLRNEPSHRYSDLGPFLQHLPDFAANELTTKPGLPIPIECTLHLQKYINQFPVAHALLCNACNALTDTLSSFYRIRTSPIPVAYSLHLKQVLILYLTALPFQLVASPLGWWTIPVVLVSAACLLGIERIGLEIENPFGYDLNDLPQDDYFEAIRDELLDMMQAHNSRNDGNDATTTGWIEPISLSVECISLDKVRQLAAGDGENEASGRESGDSRESKRWVKNAKEGMDNFVGSVARAWRP